MTNMIVRNRVQLNPWNEMDRIWDSLYKPAQVAPRKPVVNIVNEENKVILTAELPGFGPEDIDIQVKENLLILQALKRVEIKESSEEVKEEKEEKEVVFEKSFVLPEDLRRENFVAQMKNGLLTLELPRSEKPAPLAIKVISK
ncbi:Hsp20/alpha crystallin family protein [Oceanispirochaeta sp.]|jgi:HSP20 family protein|uniref:Hsp20/alpha crystallin family protein n=1 Tax=Oceanispirochaeta sp. TaxID=2035350 RepID=UPI00261CAABD|nr:Hsp20/alpha crystallin family protein [Oceanispirochaeta sp.]MDA3958730.1 Hsp20/alpha crystallin family protein [Oceanispirochaeta sp.]